MTNRSGWIRGALAFSLIVVALALGGCYANVPAQDGDVASNNPNTDTIRDVMVAAGRAVLTDSPIDGPIQVALPKGTVPLSYDYVLPRISSSATAATGEAEATAPTLDIKQVRVRGWKAQVDVVRPMSAAQPGGAKQVVMVDLSYDPVAKWHADQVSVYRTSVDRVLRANQGGGSVGESIR